MKWGVFALRNSINFSFLRADISTWFCTLCLLYILISSFGIGICFVINGKILLIQKYLADWFIMLYHSCMIIQKIPIKESFELTYNFGLSTILLDIVKPLQGQFKKKEGAGSNKVTPGTNWQNLNHDHWMTSMYLPNPSDMGTMQYKVNF